MIENREKVIRVLEEMLIAYQLIEHPPVYTITEMEGLSLDQNECIVKNLFLREDKKARYFLVAMKKDKRVNLKELRTQLASRTLKFASEEDLATYLHLTKGAVTPFGIINDDTSKVEVVMDRDVCLMEQIGVHPNENTATILLAPQDLEKVFKKQNCLVHYVTIR